MSTTTGQGHPEAHVEHDTKAPFHEKTPLHASETAYSPEQLAALHTDADAIVARYPSNARRCCRCCT